jgi:hypothetical protein
VTGREPDLVPPPRRPPSGGRVVLHVALAMTAAFVFSMGTRLLILLLIADRFDASNKEWVLVVLWSLPIFGVAAAAISCGRRGWKGAQIGLWIYVGLGILSTAYCGALASML